MIKLSNEIKNAKLDSGLTLSASIGYASKNAVDLSKLLKEADDMMYAGKTSMKNKMKEKEKIESV